VSNFDVLCSRLSVFTSLKSVVRTYIITYTNFVNQSSRANRKNDVFWGKKRRSSKQARAKPTTMAAGASKQKEATGSQFSACVGIRQCEINNVPTTTNDERK